MDDTIKQGFLNGMEFSEFIILYIWALMGALISFWRSVDKQIKTNSNTPNKWHWPSLWKGIKRTIITLIGIAVAIIYWDPQVSQFLFSQSVELNGWSAFIIIGVGSDKITETFFGEAESGINYFKKKLNGNSH